LSWSLQFWPVLVCSFVAALAATWLCKKIALKLGIVDTPDNLVKTHKEPVAYLGGVGILVGLTVGILGGIVLLKDTEGFDQSLTWLLGILTGAGIACFVF
jgi:UDP-N-acetylmuramyl pentapeptide phosphotransferase/UDP-N-acetylglucosamine-1-phosphate transferase